MRIWIGSLIVATLLCACAQPHPPLAVALPTGWKLSYTARSEHYAIHSADGQNVLMFAPWPPPTGRSQIASTLTDMARSFVTNAPSENIKLATTSFVIQPLFQGSEGSFVKFEIVDGNSRIVQTVFMFPLHERIWRGQFTGTAEGWTNALTVLERFEGGDRSR